MDVRERMAGVDRQRRQDREDARCGTALPRDCRSASVSWAKRTHSIPLRGERRDAPPRASRRSCSATSSRTRWSIAASCCGGVHPVGGIVLRLDPGVQLLLQSGDPDLEELVEVAAEDGEELEALEQRIRGVRGFFQHARVELEPATARGSGSDPAETRERRPGPWPSACRQAQRRAGVAPRRPDARRRVARSTPASASRRRPSRTEPPSARCPSARPAGPCPRRARSRARPRPTSTPTALMRCVCVRSSPSATRRIAARRRTRRRSARSSRAKFGCALLGRRLAGGSARRWRSAPPPAPSIPAARRAGSGDRRACDAGRG